MAARPQSWRAAIGIKQRTLQRRKRENLQRPHPAAIRSDVSLPNNSERSHYSDDVQRTAAPGVRTSLGPVTVTFIPISGIHGDNIVASSARTGWYRGPTLMASLQTIEIDEGGLQRGPFRMPVQRDKLAESRLPRICGDHRVRCRLSWRSHLRSAIRTGKYDRTPRRVRRRSRSGRGEPVDHGDACRRPRRLAGRRDLVDRIARPGLEPVRSDESRQQDGHGDDQPAKYKINVSTFEHLVATGLEFTGKSTIANIVQKRLHASGYHPARRDGDNVRHCLNKDLGFSDADRVENVRRVAEVARLVVDAGLIVLVAFSSPFKSERRSAPGVWWQKGSVSAGVEVCLGDVAAVPDALCLWRPLQQQWGRTVLEPCATLRSIATGRSFPRSVHVPPPASPRRRGLAQADDEDA